MLTRVMFDDYFNKDGSLNSDFTESTENHPFMYYELAIHAINMYTNIAPGIVYKVINKVFGEELYEHIPYLFPLSNLIDIGITNYYDVSGCLN